LRRYLRRRVAHSNGFIQCTKSEKANSVRLAVAALTDSQCVPNLCAGGAVGIRIVVEREGSQRCESLPWLRFRQRIRSGIGVTFAPFAKRKNRRRRRRKQYKKCRFV